MEKKYMIKYTEKFDVNEGIILPMIEKDTISVIVPIYNVEKYLERCVNSITRQTYDKLQIILVDDGSEDSGGMICDRLAQQDNRICVIHKNWGGLADTRNVGLALATGEYISFVDSDDYIQDTMLEQMHMAMKKHRCEIAVCGRADIFENNIKIRNKKAFCMKKETVFEWREAQKEYFRGQYIEQASCCDKMFHYSVVDGIRFPPGKTSEDIYFTYRAYMKSKRIVHVAKPLYCYCHRKGSICTTFPVDKSELDIMLFVKNVEKEVWNKKEWVVQRSFYSFYVSMFNMLYEEFKKSAEVDKKFRKYIVRLKMEAFLRIVFIIGNPYIPPERKKLFFIKLFCI